MIGPNIIVVGAGLASQTLSLGLAQLGFDVCLVERRANMQKRKGGAYIMQPNALKALSKWYQTYKKNWIV